MVVSDEVKNRQNIMSFDELEFYEALCRCASMVDLPTTMDVLTSSCVDLLDYEEKLRTKQIELPTTSSDTPPLYERVDAFINLLVGRLAVHFRGVFQVGSERVNFVKDGYITHHQLAHIMA